MKPTLTALTAALLLAAPCLAGGTPAAPDMSAATAAPAAPKDAPKKSKSRISREDLEAALAENPDLIVKALAKIGKTDQSKFFEIVVEAQHAYQLSQEERELENALKNPFTPKIDDKTRVRGDKDAPITLVEYSDFECPYCQKGFQIVEALKEKYGKRMRFIYKHMPLVNLHPQAMPAARWQEAVALQSPEKAWDFHDTMFKNQEKLGDAKTADEFFHQTVKDMGLDVKKAEKDASSQAVQDKIDADSKEGAEFGFTGTPGFLVNGVAVRGAYPPGYFDMIIQKLGVAN